MNETAKEKVFAGVGFTVLILLAVLIMPWFYRGVGWYFDFVGDWFDDQAARRCESL